MSESSVALVSPGEIAGAGGANLFGEREKAAKAGFPVGSGSGVLCSSRLPSERLSGGVSVPDSGRLIRTDRGYVDFEVDPSSVRPTGVLIPVWVDDAVPLLARVEALLAGRGPFADRGRAATVSGSSSSLPRFSD